MQLRLSRKSGARFRLTFAAYPPARIAGLPANALGRPHFSQRAGFAWELPLRHQRARKPPLLKRAAELIHIIFHAVLLVYAIRRQEMSKEAFVHGYYAPQTSAASARAQAREELSPTCRSLSCTLSNLQHYVVLGRSLLSVRSNISPHQDILSSSHKSTCANDFACPRSFKANPLPRRRRQLREQQARCSKCK